MQLMITIQAKIRIQVILTSLLSLKITIVLGQEKSRFLKKN